MYCESRLQYKSGQKNKSLKFVLWMLSFTVLLLVDVYA